MEIREGNIQAKLYRCIILCSYIYLEDISHGPVRKCKRGLEEYKRSTVKKDTVESKCLIVNIKVE